MRIQNIAVVGVGGVGGYFGGKLCRLEKEDPDVRISFIARGEHLRAIQTSGLLLTSEHEPELVCRPTLATDDISKLPRPDLVLVCVKEFDLPAILSALQNVIDERTVVLPLLNGVDVYRRVRRVIDGGIVLPACVYVGTHIERPGQVVQKGGGGKILFGTDPGHPEFDPRDIVQFLARAGITSQCVQEIQTEIWQKFIFICAYGLVSAARGNTLGEILERDTLRGEVEAIMREVASLAQCNGVTLPESVVEASLLKARNFPHGAKTSFQRDFECADKKDERDLFAGTMIRMADQFAVPIPRTREVAALLEKKKPTLW